MDKFKRKSNAIRAPLEHKIHVGVGSKLFEYNISKEIDCKQILQSMHSYANEFPFVPEKVLEQRPETQQYSNFYGALHPHLKVDYFDDLIINIEEKLAAIIKNNFFWYYRASAYEISEKQKFVDFKVGESWLVKYKKGEWTPTHNHFQAPFTCVFYPNCVEDTSPIYFGENYNVKPESGTLIIFQGMVPHSVPKSISDTERYCFVANLYSVWDN